MDPVLTILLLLAVAAGWYLFRTMRPRPKPEAPVERRQQKTHGAWHAVAIKVAPTSCFHAQALSGRRYLAGEAPTLPLKNCDATSCECRFVHYEDRRSGKDRRSPFGSSGLAGNTGRFAIERRQGGDRRGKDPDLL